jgi:hypothetical protein
MCGGPQPSEHSEVTPQDCGSEQKLQSAAWGAPRFLRAPGRAGGRQAKKLLGWTASKPNYKTLPNTSREEHFDCPGQHGTSSFMHPATFVTLQIHTSRLRQWAEAAKCGVGRPTSFFEPRAERGDGKRRSCWAGSHPPSQTTPPCQSTSREEHFDCPGPHGMYACVASRNLRITSSSHFKTAAAGRSCKVRQGVHHIFLRAPGRAGGKHANELLGGIASSKPNYTTLPKHFPRRAFRLSRAARNFGICGVPQTSEHFQFTLQD